MYFCFHKQLISGDVKCFFFIIAKARKKKVKNACCCVYSRSVLRGGVLRGEDEKGAARPPPLPPRYLLPVIFNPPLIQLLNTPLSVLCASFHLKTKKTDKTFKFN